jgi:hypothetical protein
MEPTLLATGAGFRAWLERHHDSVSELLVGFHRKGGRADGAAADAPDRRLSYPSINSQEDTAGRSNTTDLSRTTAFSSPSSGSMYWSSCSMDTTSS